LGWPSSWSPMREKWSRWWRSSSASSSAGPPANSNRYVVDLVRRSESSTIAWLGESKGMEMSLLCKRAEARRGGGVGEVEVGWGMVRGTWHNCSAWMTRTQDFSRIVREEEADNQENKITQHGWLCT
jgi:hypothetical protein